MPKQPGTNPVPKYFIPLDKHWSLNMPPAISFPRRQLFPCSFLPFEKGPEFPLFKPMAKDPFPQERCELYHLAGFSTSSLHLVMVQV